MKAFKWLWKYLRQYRYRLFWGLMLTILVAALNMVTPYISGKIVDNVIIKGNKGLLLPILSIVAVVTVSKAFIRYFYQLIFERVSQNAIYNARKDIYNNLQHLDFDFFDKTKTGDIMARMTGDMDAIRHFVAWVIYSIFENLLVFIFAIIMMLYINVKFTLMLLLVTPITAYFAIKLARTVIPTFRAIREQFSKLNSVVQENISGNRVVKAFAKEDYEIQKFSVQNEGYKSRQLDSAKVWERYLPILDTIPGFLSVIMLLVGGIMVINHEITLGVLVTFNNFIFALTNPLRMSGWLISDTQWFVASTEKIIGLIETQPQIVSDEVAAINEEIVGDIEFKNVSFSYGDGTVLDNVSFKVKSGQTIGIIGPTGSGKSTLVSLIGRFYDATCGEVLIDGINVKEIDLKTLRENIAVTMQDVFLFSDTIEGNIAYGEPYASIDKVQWAADTAEANEFIESFPEGYDTIVGERGVGLSGGQKQRIALARALLKNSSIIILDDTTSAIDMETEFEIQKALNSYFGEKTTFIIAHRISSVKNADMILVLKDGKIIEQGKHNELIKKNGYYSTVYSTQCGDFDGKVSEVTA